MPQLKPSRESGIWKKYYRKPKNGSKGEDFRWKKEKKFKKNLNPDQFDATGDTIPQVESHVANQQTNGKEAISSVKRRQLEAKRKRREKHDDERTQANKLLRETPHEYLWQQYSEWAGKKAKGKSSWTEDQVLSCVASEKESLLTQMKDLIGADYATHFTKKSWKENAAGVACIALSSAAGRAVALAPKIYDGRPVAKLFGKHIKTEEQKEWLRVCREKIGVTPTAVGTAKRVQRLVEEKDLSLQATTVLLVDFVRDGRLKNILDMDATKDELFELIEKIVDPLIRKGSLKILLYVPSENDPTCMHQVVGKGALTPA